MTKIRHRVRILYNGNNEDFTILYIDDKPAVAVEEQDGGYYTYLNEAEYIHNPVQSCYWYVQDAEWHFVYADMSSLVNIMEGYNERIINDGSQIVYDGDIMNLEKY